MIRIIQAVCLFITTVSVFTACSTYAPKSKEASRSTASESFAGLDVYGDFLIAKSAEGNSHVVEMTLKKRGEMIYVTSYKEGVNDSVSNGSCQGNAFPDGDIVTIDVVCGSSENVFKVNFQNVTNAALKNGANIQVQSPVAGQMWLNYTLIKSKKPYFR